MNVYCPMCGEWFTTDEVIELLPGEAISLTCPHCETEWKIMIEFREVAKEAETRA